jgi:hypothetical protein
MPGQIPPRRAWQPSWRALGGGAFALFAVVLAFLAGRVRAGTDPGVARAASSSPPTAVQQQRQTTPDPSQGDDPGFDDSPALPQDDGSGSVAPDPDPPTTHAS